ncbi:subunit 2 of splicing factor 3A-like [Vairimorpha necatrix]|uniref:Subunit 2 of splicing factor 3A-like n=1 Tax=Vairimorpha necatrix TaxID=6039 RepID=A0AAX4JAU4_9MICR
MEITNIKHPKLKLKGYRIKYHFKSKPKFRILNALEQCVEKYNEDYIYLVFRCKNEENVGIRIRKCIILEEFSVEKYEEQIYQLDLFYM